MPSESAEFHDRAAILESSQSGRGRLAGMGAKPRILLVEDDRQLAGMLADLFEEEGHEVDVAHDGQVALHLALTRTYDAFVFDRGVPVIDGVELLRTLRARDCSVPSLILTARGSVADRVEGLDAGAEDYLVKPFEIPELLARMRALLRR
ncbi:response regulator [Rhodococcus erythropolis]|uniref:response regulator transcription factor n=2 Tax=Rhodococcus TaxID=1827 RepID=UPI0029493685|nr:response regulator [Rhodococcus erythropolis]MDV6274979.1 response regulator [Rhodococcus erythropolis]